MRSRRTACIASARCSRSNCHRDDLKRLTSSILRLLASVLRAGCYYSVWHEQASRSWDSRRGRSGIRSGSGSPTRQGRTSSIGTTCASPVESIRLRWARTTVAKALAEDRSTGPPSFRVFILRTSRSIHGTAWAQTGRLRTRRSSRTTNCSNKRFRLRGLRGIRGANRMGIHMRRIRWAASGIR